MFWQILRAIFTTISTKSIREDVIACPCYLGDIKSALNLCDKKAHNEKLCKQQRNIRHRSWLFAWGNNYIKRVHRLALRGIVRGKKFDAEIMWSKVKTSIYPYKAFQTFFTVSLPPTLLQLLQITKLTQPKDEIVEICTKLTSWYILCDTANDHFFCSIWKTRQASPWQMRNFGHGKNSQHAFIKSVILRQSFLSAMKRIISTRAIGICPCGYLTACLH